MIAHSEHGRERLVAELGLEPGRVHVIPHGALAHLTEGEELAPPFQTERPVVLFFGLLVYYARANRFFYVVLTAFVMTSSVMVSYARARAESLIPLCKVGFMERPERLVLLIIGGLVNRMAQVLWVIAVISTITVIHRIVYTWQETRAGRVLPGIRLNL